MFPLLEFRFAIPIGVGMGVPVWLAVLISVVFATIATKLLFIFIPVIADWAKVNSPRIHRFLDKLFIKTRKEHSQKFKVFSEIALIFFVAFPFPGTGIFTASLLVYLFDLPRKQSFWSMMIGIVIGGAIIGLGVNVFELFWGAANQGMEGVQQLVK